MNKEWFNPFKIIIKKIISAYSYGIIALSLLLLFFGGHFILNEVSDENSSWIFEVLFILIYILLTAFVILPVTCYYLYKKDFVFLKKQLLINVLLYSSLYIGPYVRYNVFSYSQAIKNIEQSINKGQWEDAYAFYNVLYIRNKQIGIPYIRRCQIKLKAANFYKAEINGMLSNELYESITRFQKFMDIAQDGQIGTRTNTLLVSFISKDKLYLPNDINFFRYHYEKLDSSIRYFQKRNGLVVDGEIGPETEKILLEHLKIPW